MVPTFERELVDPDTQEHALTADELRQGRAFADKWFPALAQQPLVDSRICQREDSVDEHFIVQQHPELRNVWVVGGGSGHGYKHGIMLGDYVAHRVAGTGQEPGARGDLRAESRDVLISARSEKTARSQSARRKDRSSLRSLRAPRFFPIVFSVISAQLRTSAALIVAASDFKRIASRPVAAPASLSSCAATASS